MIKNKDIQSYTVTPIKKNLGGPELFEIDYRNKNVVDLACGNGAIGRHALYKGAKHVQFTDVRQQSFVEPNNYRNWSWHFVDLNEIEMLTNILQKQDIVMYSGHFYHATNHLEILDAIAISSCQELFFETKVFHTELDYHENSPAVRWVSENTNDSELIWHSTAASLLVGQPNFKWTFDALFERFLIKDIKVVEDSWYNPSFNVTVNFKKLMFHCQSQN